MREPFLNPGSLALELGALLFMFEDEEQRRAVKKANEKLAFLQLTASHGKSNNQWTGSFGW